MGHFDLAGKQGHELIRLCHYQHEVNEGLTMHTVAALVVLGSPVQSGFSSIFKKTETVTGPPCPGYSKKLDRTVIDRSTAVFYGFLRLRDWSKPVMVSTG